MKAGDVVLQSAAAEFSYLADLCFFLLLLYSDTKDAFVPKVRHLPPARTCLWVCFCWLEWFFSV